MRTIAIGVLGAVLLLRLLTGCGAHPAHPIAPPQVGELPPYASTQPTPPQPHPEHPIARPPRLGWFAALHGHSIRDVWLNTPCETATDGSEWCGHIALPHVEHY